jgi:uncharacterized protein (DUF697 family)
MAEQMQSSWLRRKVEVTIRNAFMRAYGHVKVDPARFLMQLRAAHRLPISNYQGVFALDLRLLDRVAEDTISSGMRLAALQGAGFGLGGLLTLVPDLSLLAAITLRTIQKLSLVYGFEFNTDREMAELWIAAASAAGVDISRELIEKEVVNKFVPKVIQRIAAKASGEVVEKWAGRLIPLVSSLIGAALNYYFIRAWGERAKRYFRAKHLEMRPRMTPQRATLEAQTPAAISGQTAPPSNGRTLVS